MNIKNTIILVVVTILIGTIYLEIIKINERNDIIECSKKYDSTACDEIFKYREFIK